MYYLTISRSNYVPSSRSTVTDMVMLMHLTLNGSDNCTAIALRPCNGRPMLWRTLEVVGLIIIIIIIIIIMVMAVGRVHCGKEIAGGGGGRTDLLISRWMQNQNAASSVHNGYRARYAATAFKSITNCII